MIDMADLIIIGNGFDLAHDIKSKYSDFKEYVKNINGDTDIMDTYFSTKADFWSNVELALSNYDLDHIFDECTPGEDWLNDESFKTAYQYEDAPDNLRNIVDEFKRMFNEWVNNIDIDNVQTKFQLQSNDLYLTFNYTEVLEKYYSIPPKNILHIHGERGGNSEYVIGHNNYVKPLSAYTSDGITPEETARMKIIEIMNSFDKKSADIIKRKQKFFSQLGSVSEIVTIGHSLNEIDWPYFEKIVKETGNNKVWEMHCFSVNDKNNANKMIAKFGLTNVKIIK